MLAITSTTTQGGIMNKYVIALRKDKTIIYEFMANNTIEALSIAKMHLISEQIKDSNKYMLAIVGVK